MKNAHRADEILREINKLEKEILADDAALNLAPRPSDLARCSQQVIYCKRAEVRDLIAELNFISLQLKHEFH